jgi:adenine phosphoribosyltransferase
LLADARALAATVDHLAEPYLGRVDRVLGIESRGFIVGSAVAYRLGVGMVIARKPGKLPFHCVAQKYQLEYGSDALEIHRDAIAPNDRVLIVDDLLATGGTAQAAMALVTTLGGSVVGCAFIIELGFLKGRERVAPAKCFSLISYE